MTKQEIREKIIAYIDATTDYDAATITFHRDGTVSGIKDANKTFSGPETDRLLIGYADALAKDAQDREAGQ